MTDVILTGDGNTAGGPGSPGGPVGPGSPAGPCQQSIIIITYHIWYVHILVVLGVHHYHQIHHYHLLPEG